MPIAIFISLIGGMFLSMVGNFDFLVAVAHNHYLTGAVINFTAYVIMRMVLVNKDVKFPFRMGMIAAFETGSDIARDSGQDSSQ